MSGKLTNQVAHRPISSPCVLQCTATDAVHAALMRLQAGCFWAQLVAACSSKAEVVTVPMPPVIHLMPCEQQLWEGNLGRARVQQGRVEGGGSLCWDQAGRG